MPEPLTISAAELGPMLQPDLKDPARWLQRHHAMLTEKTGMPKKLPGGWVWSRLAVMAWIGTYGAPTATRVAVAENLIRTQQCSIMDAFQGRAA